MKRGFLTAALLAVAKAASAQIPPTLDPLMADRIIGARRFSLFTDCAPMSLSVVVSTGGVAPQGSWTVV